MPCDRHWFLTWHTYGTWLPGKEEGFVSRIRDDSGESIIHNIPGTLPDANLPLLEEWSQDRLKATPIHLTIEQARVVAEQFLETATIRKWKMLALAVISNHVHLVVGVIGDPKPAKILNDFKSYATRALNREFSRPASDSWWTESGSKRKLSGEESILGAVRYTVEQDGALVVWTAVIPELNLAGGYLKR